MAFSSLPSIKVINSFEVSPPAGSSPTHAIIPLTFFDMMMINADHVERLFFYHFPPSNFNSDNFISSLRSSLSHTLKYFYPFAGKLRCSTNGNDNKFEVVYTQGDSVSFVVSECNNSRFEELASYLPRSVSHLKPLVPYLPISDESQPLLAVQVTIFPDQGIVVGTSVHHAICDGNSSMQFMHSWAATNLSGSFDSSLKPITDRTLVPDPWDLCTIISRSSNKETPIPGPVISNENCVATFTLNKERIERLKRFISYKAEEMKKSFHCSTIVVSFAFAWMCYIKSQKEHSETKKLAGLLVPTDFRARIEPPIPRTYFGNCIGPCLVQVDRKDFFNNHGLVLVAQAIRKTIDELTYGDKFADDMGRFSAFVRNVDLMTMGGSPRFRVYGVNFGLGKPKKVEMISVAKVDRVAVAESREEEGGVELGITLDKAEMDSFVKYFTSDLNFEI